MPWRRGDILDEALREVAMSATFCLLLMTVVICVSALAYRGIGRWTPRPKELPAGNPEAILLERFAKGDIDETDYARRLSIVRYGPPLELR